jgi:hypothetical protein
MPILWGVEIFFVILPSLRKTRYIGKKEHFIHDIGDFLSFYRHLNKVLIFYNTYFIGFRDIFCHFTVFV